jgi:hypothetical protein
VSTAPGIDGIVRRIEVEAPRRAIERRLGRLRARQHHRPAARSPDRRAAFPAGRLGPDLARSRFQPHRSDHAERGLHARPAGEPLADVFRSRSIPVRSSPSSPNCPRPSCRRSIYGSRRPTRTRSNAYTLFRGIVIGIAGLLALFLTILFVVKGTSMFPATAALAWAVLGLYLHRFRLPESGHRHHCRQRTALWRAGTEVFLAADLRGLPVHLSQPQPLARCISATERSPGYWPGMLFGRCDLRSADCVRHRAPSFRADGTWPASA